MELFISNFVGRVVSQVVEQEPEVFAVLVQAAQESFGIVGTIPDR